ncbi:hypothetical protein AZE42_07623 [Rhizopogon vesiculosus]|uniref:VWFA domain-containing protein n=1 Tax=Rhizopogon vesiculosus TaxID=180088 RepID=A0A1J8Q394_9AGAM|nr:hypothetical protein AZE42_07623 [Rhizopogon vesiculosus]
MAYTLASSGDTHLSAPSDILHPLASVYGDRRLIQKSQWQEEAFQSSARVVSQGTPLPVGVEGTIPDGAVPFYEDSTGPLYIARGLIEGELYLGTVGPSMLPGGAIISFKGRNHIMNQYEVLVCLSYLKWSLPLPYNTRTPPSPGLVVLASQGRSTGANHSLHQRDISRLVYRQPAPRLNERQQVQLKHLVLVPSYDYRSHLTFPSSISETILLIDNTLSMGRCWRQLEEALAGVADSLGQTSDWTGVDVFFLHGEATHVKLKTRADFRNTLRAAPRYDEAKNLAPKLANIVDVYFRNAESKENGHKRTSLLILTDGSPVNLLHESIDQNETVNVIVEAARKLEKNTVGEDMFRIYILQFGDDRTAAIPLKEIGNEVAKQTLGRVSSILKA